MGSDEGSAPVAEPLLLSKSAQDEPLESSESYGPFCYNSGRRNFQDVLFLLIFLVLVLATFCFGIFAVANRNRSFGKASYFVYNRNSSSCGKYSLREDPGSVLSRTSDLSFASPEFGWVGFASTILGNSERDVFLRDSIWTFVVTLILSVPIASGLLWLLKNYTKQLVYACLPFFVLIPVLINVFWFVACIFNRECKQVMGLAPRVLIFLFVLVLCGIIAWVIIGNWHRVELTVRILNTAALALSANLGLLVALPSLSLALLVYYVPIVVFLVFSRWNGRVVPNFKVVDSGYSCGGSTGVECCIWKQDAWVPAYFTLAIITMLWSLVVMVEAQVYIISGTIAQWYFHRADSSPPRSLGIAIRHAFGPSFGTVCFSGMIFGVARVVRAAVETARDEAREGIIYGCLRCCVDIVLASIEFLNKFTINFAAITGESYCSSAKLSYELLKRNLLSAVVVETISTRILFGIMFVVTVIYAIAVCAILKACTLLQGYVYAVTVVAWVLLFLILFYFVHVMDNVVDAVYICYAMDRDTGAISKAHIHNIYAHLPTSRNYNTVFAISHV